MAQTLENTEARNEQDKIGNEIDDHITSHPLVASLLGDSSYRASRPHLDIPASFRPHSLTGGLLLGPGRITTAPFAFVRPDGSSYYAFFHLGEDLCGHPGIVHGGVLATLLDEGLAGACFPALPSKMGVTASMKIDYKKPCKAGQYVVIAAETTKVEGKKAWVKGRIGGLGRDTEAVEGGNIFAEAEGLYIDPK